MDPSYWPEPVPTPEEWLRLFKAAEVFKAARPWDWMVEEQLFAVENPETGDMGFCSITGELGEHLALIVYLGVEALGKYLTAVRGMKYADSYLDEREHSMMLLEAPQLQASFESREMVSDLDWQILKTAKVRIRGREAWPVFRAFAPTRVPWYVNGPQTRFLTVLLEQAALVAEAQRENSLSIPSLSVANLPATLPLLLRSRVGDDWASAQHVFTPEYPIPFVGGSMSDDALRAIRRNLPLKSLDMQVHLTMMSMPVAQGPLPPYFPYVLFVVDAGQGLVAGAELILAHPTLADLWPQVLPMLLSVFERMEMRPKRLQIVSERLFSLLAAPLGQLGIELARVEQMPELEEALASFENWAQQRQAV